jgi:hypothetical protein
VANDEVLLINLMGTTSSIANLGKYETLRIQSIAAISGGSRVTFTTNKVNYYGNGATDDTGLGVVEGTQRVMLQRVPNYTTVTVNSSYNFTPSAWDGAKGGVMFFRATGTVNVNGNIHAAALGWRGGGMYSGGYGGLWWVGSFCAITITQEISTAAVMGGLYSSGTGFTPNCGGGGGGGAEVYTDHMLVPAHLAPLP